ncbi:MAG: hypothetical protein ACR2OH_06675, partial [Microthrixaceae bacterium]
MVDTGFDQTHPAMQSGDRTAHTQRSEVTSRVGTTGRDVAERRKPQTRRSPLSDVVASLVGDDLPVAIRFYDGGRLGPKDPRAVIEVRSPAALSRILTAPGELGFARAYVAGDIDLVGDIYSVLELRHRIPNPRLSPSQWMAALKVAGPLALRPLPAPRQEARQRGRVHSMKR